MTGRLLGKLALAILNQRFHWSSTGDEGAL